MALILKDRVKETTTTTGTGTLTLGGAVTGYQAFDAAIGSGNTTYYAIYLDGGSEWEVGLGTVGTGTLARTTVYASSNGGSAVNFSAGQKSVWGDYPAIKAMFLDSNGDVSETIGSFTNITGHISSPDYIEFDTTYATTLAAGQLGWNGNDTLGLGMIGGNVIQHIGEDQFFYCKATSTITKGQVVMFTGAVGASGVPTGAPATGITDGTYIMGIAAEAIATNGFGLVQSFGTLRNVNTSGYSDGDILWYNPSVAGGLTKTKPSAPNVKVQMAAVINGGSSGGGTILIRVNAGSTLGGTDSNAQITSPSNGQILTYDGADAYWKNTSLTAGTGISLSAASDGTLTVTNTAPSSGGTVTSVTGTSPIASSGGTTPAISISQATTSTDGYLSSTDWNTFNNKQPAGTYVTSVGATSPVTSTGGTTPTIAMPQATGSVSGYLSSTDWTTFNNKGSGTVTSVSATSPVTSTGGTTPTIAMPAATSSVSGYLTSTDWTTFNNKATYPTQTGNSGKYLKTDGTSPSWSAIPTYLPVLQRAGTTSNVSLGNGYLPVLTYGGSTTNVTIY